MREEDLVIDFGNGSLRPIDSDIGGSPEATAAERWERAQDLFEARDYIQAAKLLSEVVDEVPGQTGPRLLLARAYYHSAQLRRAEEQLREVVERDPVEQYAHLLLGRMLERQTATTKRPSGCEWPRPSPANR